MSNTSKQPDILIVDDQSAMRAALRIYLQAMFPGHGILEAANGADALEICVKHRPTLVLMDVCLPDANGIELTGRLMKLMPELSVIVDSCLDDRAYAEHAHAAGALAYIVKDNLTTELIPVVAKVLGTAPVDRAHPQGSGPWPGSR